MQMPDVSSIINMATARPCHDGSAHTQQAAIIAYANDFKLLMYLTLATNFAVFVIGTSRLPARLGRLSRAMPWTDDVDRLLLSTRRAGRATCSAR